MKIERFISKVVQKLIYELNRLIFRKMYSNFEFHPKTLPLETNPALGLGNGHALSRDLHLLIPFLSLLRILGCKSILDLGSGDGFVLSLAQKLNYSEIIGVEADPELFQLSKKNCIDGKFYELYFQHIDPKDFLKPIDCVYLFNPTDYKTTIDTCAKFRGRWYLMKNFSLLDQDKTRLKVFRVISYKSYNLYRSKIKLL